MRAAIVATLVVAMLWNGSAAADDDPDVGAGTTDGGLVAHAIDDDGTPTPSGGTSSSPQSDGPTILIGQAACPGAEQAASTPEIDVSYCNADDQQPALTLADVQKAFAELPLPAGTLVIQPPDGLTLVNFKTNFYTTSTAPISTTVTLLEQPVTLEATPATYTWHFGDGETTSTTEPGAAYPRLTITHDYKLKGDYQPSLSTTYTGRYKIADGPWQTIPGTVTIDGPTQPLRAIEAQPKLVGY